MCSHDIAEILLKLALNTNQSINIFVTYKSIAAMKICRKKNKVLSYTQILHKKVLFLPLPNIKYMLYMMFNMTRGDNSLKKSLKQIININI